MVMVVSFFGTPIDGTYEWNILTVHGFNWWRNLLTCWWDYIFAEYVSLNLIDLDRDTVKLLPYGLMVFLSSDKYRGFSQHLWYISGVINMGRYRATCDMLFRLGQTVGNHHHKSHKIFETEIEQIRLHENIPLDPTAVLPNLSMKNMHENPVEIHWTSLPSGNST